MATSRPFAYNTGSTISGTVQVGNLAVGTPSSGFGSTGLKWWNGPDEDLGYVIAHQMPLGNQPNQFSVPAYVGFNRSDSLTEESFKQLTSVLSGGLTFADGNAASSWLTSNGYWNSWVNTTPTPTPTITPTKTPTPTPTISVTPTITPTLTPTISVTPTLTPTKTLTPTPSSTPSTSSGVTFSQTFTSGVSPGTTIENAWTTFRSQLTGTYTRFTFTSSLVGSTSYDVTDAVKVQDIANALRTGTTGVTFATTISGVTWNVGCCTCRAGGAINGAVEFANVGLCSGSSTAALRPFINNSNWGGIGSTVGAATQTLTLTFY